MKSSSTVYLIMFVLSLSVSGCVDSVEPAGPAQYENPDFPSDLRGYALIPSTFSHVFSYQERIFVLDRTRMMLLSFSASDPNLAIPESLVVKDTLLLGVSPGTAAFCSENGSLFFSHNTENDIYRLDDLQSGAPLLLHNCESIVSELFPVADGASLLICFLGPEWAVRKINAQTGETQAEYQCSWPITRAAVSADNSRILIANSSMEYLIELDTETLAQTDSIAMPERIGPFLYNSSGNIVVFNQYAIKPRVYLVDGNSGEIEDVIQCVNAYRVCSLISGTDIVLAPRRSDSRISVLNSENMIFAPSIFCFNSADQVFSDRSGDIIVVAIESPGRVYIFENSDE